MESNRPQKDVFHDRTLLFTPGRVLSAQSAAPIHTGCPSYRRLVHIVKSSEHDALLDGQTRIATDILAASATICPTQVRRSGKFISLRKALLAAVWTLS